MNTIRRHPLALGTLLLLALGSQPAAHAQPPGRGGPPARPFFVELRYTPSISLESDFKDAPGSIAKQQQDVTGTITVPIPRRGVVNASLSYDHFSADFSGTQQLDGLLENAYATRADLSYAGRFTGDWSLFALASVDWNAETDADRGEARTESAMIMLQRDLTESIEWGFGLVAGTELDDSDDFFPLVSLSWDITDRLRLRTRRGIQLLYTLDTERRWQAALDIEYLSRTIRLNEAGPGDGGVYRSRLVLTSLALLYRPNPGLFFGAEIGIVPWQNIRVRDADRQTLFDQDVEPGAVGALSASLRF
jgi:hypothetical protein